MKKSLIVMGAIAVAVLAGCKSEEVMDTRQYSPDYTGTGTFVANPRPRQSRRQAPKGNLAPMTNAQTSGGVSSATDGYRPGQGKLAGTTYVVQKGDTLTKIARRNGVTVNGLMQANNLGENDAKKLQVGHKLTIPGGKLAQSKSPAKSKVAPKLSADGTYVVKSGDSPAKIAHMFKVKTSDLMAINNLNQESAKRLKIGDKLMIPAGGSARTAATAEQKKDVQFSDETVGARSDAPTDGMPSVMPADDAQGDSFDGTEDTEMTEVEEDAISVSDFCTKNGITIEQFKRNNNDYTDPLRKGDPVFIPKK